MTIDGSGPGDTLAAPFIGFTIGTACVGLAALKRLSSELKIGPANRLFGITLTQAYQYFLRYAKEPLFCKVKVFVLFRECQPQS
jgi:hypothetical protein